MHPMLILGMILATVTWAIFFFTFILSLLTKDEKDRQVAASGAILMFALSCVLTIIMICASNVK